MSALPKLQLSLRIGYQRNSKWQYRRDGIFRHPAQIDSIKPLCENILLAVLYWAQFWCLLYIAMAHLHDGQAYEVDV